MAVARPSNSSSFWKDISLDPSSGVRLVHHKLHLSFPPYYLSDLKKSVKSVVDSRLTRYQLELGGILAGYGRIAILRSQAQTLFNLSDIHVDVEGDFFIFAPEVGKELVGVVNRKSHGHIGCLVHGLFNVSLPQPYSIKADNWAGKPAKLLDRVKFIIARVDLKSQLPYIEGSVTELLPQQTAEGFSTPQRQRFNSDSGVSVASDTSPGRSHEEMDKKKSKLSLTQRKNQALLVTSPAASQNKKTIFDFHESSDEETNPIEEQLLEIVKPLKELQQKNLDESTSKGSPKTKKSSETEQMPEGTPKSKKTIKEPEETPKSKKITEEAFKASPKSNKTPIEKAEGSDDPLVKPISNLFALFAKKQGIAGSPKSKKVNASQSCEGSQMVSIPEELSTKLLKNMESKKRKRAADQENEVTVESEATASPKKKKVKQEVKDVASFAEPSVPEVVPDSGIKTTKDKRKSVQKSKSVDLDVSTASEKLLEESQPVKTEEDSAIEELEAPIKVVEEVKTPKSTAKKGKKETPKAAEIVKVVKTATPSQKAKDNKRKSVTPAPVEVAEVVETATPSRKSKKKLISSEVPEEISSLNSTPSQKSNNKKASTPAAIEILQELLSPKAKSSKKKSVAPEVPEELPSATLTPKTKSTKKTKVAKEDPDTNATPSQKAKSRKRPIESEDDSTAEPTPSKKSKKKKVEEDEDPEAIIKELLECTIPVHFKSTPKGKQNLKSEKKKPVDLDSTTSKKSKSKDKKANEEAPENIVQKIMKQVQPKDSSKSKKKLQKS